MADAFKDKGIDPQEKLKQRLEKIRAKFEQEASLSYNINIAERRKTMAAAAAYFDSIDPSDPEAEGKIGFLELALKISPDNLRG